MAVTVRKAGYSDVPWLLEQAQAFEKAAGYKHRLFPGAEKASLVFAGLITNHIVLIATTGAERLGFIAGAKSNHHFNPELRLLVELLWWVPEKYRGSRAGLMLMREFERIGRAEADQVVFSLEADSPVRLEHMTRRGFRLVERSFLLEV